MHWREAVKTTSTFAAILSKCFIISSVQVGVLKEHVDFSMKSYVKAKICGKS